MKRICLFALCFTIIIGAFIPAAAAEARQEEDGKGNIVLYGRSAEEMPESYFVLSAENRQVQFSFSVPSAGKYEMVITYLNVPGNSTDSSVSIKIDGNIQCESLESVVLKRKWENDGGVRTTKSGGQISPKQKEAAVFSDFRVTDAELINDAALQLELSAGTHRLTMEIEEGAVQIGGLTLTSPEQLLPYSEAAAAYPDSAAGGKVIIIEGEDAALKSDKSLISKCDNSDPSLSPVNPVSDVINYIGSTNWQDIGEELEWEFNVPESGRYSLAFHYRQSYNLESNVYRRMKIDGKTPFSEAAQISFAYRAKWNNYTFSDDDGNPYYVYLEKGTHTLSLTVTLGELTEINRMLSQQVLAIGNIYRKIVMITGETPDANRDYDLFGQIPSLESDFTGIKATLDSLADRIAGISASKSNSYISVIRNMSNTIERMLRNSYRAADYKDDYYSNYGSLGTVVYEMRTMPLDIDSITLILENSDYKNKKTSFFESVSFSVKRFAASFITDYSEKTGGKDADKTITVWINWGRDQAQILSNLTEDSFTPETGIDVRLKIVNASLIQAMLADNSPDLSLRLSRSNPVDYAMRGALYDLTEFEDFEEVTSRFMPSAVKPYEYLDGCYALPDTQTFYVMFYRKDILGELGIDIPETWDDFIKTAAFLARKNMQVGIPYTTIESVNTTDSGIGALSLFPTVLAQFGGKLYRDDYKATLLGETPTVSAFKFWTEFYTKYSLPVSYNFYNRFRSGEMPLAVQPYTEYAKISAAASEINGLWGIACIPGVKNADGTVYNVETGGGTGSAILNNSDHKKEAWEFLKWWTSAEIQTRYSEEIESVLGAAERQPSATVDALKSFSWGKENLSVLTEQWRRVDEFPEIPGGYYVSRCIDQAYWDVVNNHTDPKNAIIKWGKLADLEIARKRSEYLLDE